jgi:gamma-carbonic anhydrase
MFAMPNATIMPFDGQYPTLADGVFVADGARLIGHLTVGKNSSFWFNTTVRADVHTITIGARTNIQDGTVIHVTHDRAATEIGDDVTVGHNATIHGCTIKDRCLIGMGAVILDRAVIRERNFRPATSLWVHQPQQ